MYVAWTASASTPEELARAVETQLNEYAEDIISVSYAVDHGHHALLVYRSIEPIDATSVGAVAVAEQIIDESYG